nr:MAG TPA: hypothetical protein [Crassvirales sp.]
MKFLCIIHISIKIKILCLGAIGYLRNHVGISTTTTIQRIKYLYQTNVCSNF